MSVHRLGPAGIPEAIPVHCTTGACLSLEPDLVAVRQPNGTLWAAWVGQPGQFISGEAGAHVSPQEVRARRHQGVGAGSTGAGSQVPSLPPGMRVCGQTFAGR